MKGNWTFRLRAGFCGFTFPFIAAHCANSSDGQFHRLTFGSR